MGKLLPLIVVGALLFYSIPVPALAQPQANGNTPPVLTQGSVSPTWGALGDTFTFQVTYQDKDGDPPAYVRLYLGREGALEAIEMTYAGGDYETGAMFQYFWEATEADIGYHQHYFETSDGKETAKLVDTSTVEQVFGGPNVLSERLDHNRICLFDKQGKELWSYETGRDWVGAVDISRDGNYIVAKTSDYLYLFSRDGSLLWRYTILGSGGENTDFSGWVSISEEGEYIAAAYGNSIALFSREKDTPLWEYRVGDNNIYTVDISSDGSYIVAGDYGDRLFLFSRESSQPVWVYEALGGVHALAISADGSYIASGTHCPDRKAYMHHRSTEEPLWGYVTSEGSPVWAAAISSDGKYAVYGLDSADTYKAVLLFEQESGTPVRAYTTDWWVRSVDISDDGKYIVAGSGDHRVYLFDRDQEEAVWTFEADERVGSVAISSDGEYIAAGSRDKKVYFFSRTGSRPLWIHTTGSWVSAVAISADSSCIVAGGGAPQYMLEGSHMVYNPEHGGQPAPVITPAPRTEPASARQVSAGSEPEMKKPVCGDGICERDKGETYENCPQDCVPEGETEPEKEGTGSQPVVSGQAPPPPASASPGSGPDWGLIGGAIAVCLMVGVVTYLLVRRQGGACSG